MRDTKKAIGIIGFGNMGSSIAERIKTKFEVWVFDKDKNKTKNSRGINIADNSIDLVNKVQTIILAVKPQDFDDVLNEVKNYVKTKLLVSIAAGINTGYIEYSFGNARVIRCMPNIGVKIGESVTCLCKGTFATDEDFAFVEELFRYLGKTKLIGEEMMDASTAIAGSGPAFIFDFIESNKIDPNNISDDTKQNIIQRLAKAAEKVGFNSEDAMFLSSATSATSLNLIKLTKMRPAELKKQVTSKGGTTEAGLEVLHRSGSWEEAAQAAVKRAQELSKRSE